MSDDTPTRSFTDPLDEIHDICQRQPECALSEIARVLGLDEIEAQYRATIAALRADVQRLEAESDETEEEWSTAYHAAVADLAAARQRIAYLELTLRKHGLCERCGERLNDERDCKWCTEGWQPSPEDAAEETPDV